MDIQAFLDEAEEAAEILNEDAADNIGLALGTALGGTNPLRNKIVIAEDGSGIVGFADWAEQLIAESTGKLGTGVLPVVAGPASPEVTSGAADVLVVRLVAADADVELGENEVAIAGGLATQMMVWEFATAVAGRLLGINPFDQPDVEAAKVAARGLLDAQPEPTPADFTDGAIEVRGGDWLGGAATAAEAVSALLGEARRRTATSASRPTSTGWRTPASKASGTSWPRSAAARSPSAGDRASCTPPASSTRADPRSASSCRSRPRPRQDLAIPDRPFTFGELISAQAAGDAQVLSEHGRPVLRLHLTDRAAGVAQLQEHRRRACRPGSIRH